MDSLKSKIDRKKAQICVLGLGYVGLPLALRFAEAGFPVLGLDIDSDKIESIQKGASSIQGIPIERDFSGSFRASGDFSLLKAVDAVIICVPTPLSKTRDPDLSLVLEAAQRVASYVHLGQLPSRPVDYAMKGTISRATTFTSFSIGLMAGPAVSL